MRQIDSIEPTILLSDKLTIAWRDVKIETSLDLKNQVVTHDWRTAQRMGKSYDSAEAGALGDFLRSVGITGISLP